MLLSAVFLTSVFSPNLIAFGTKPADPATKSAAPPVADDLVWVTRADGAQGCSPHSGQSLEEGAADLKKSKVRVLESRKGNDGKMHTQVCGAPTGATNAYLIPKSDLAQAMTLGFVPVH